MVTIEGIVVPSLWDTEGKILAVAISMADEREFLVVDNEQGKNLLRHIRRSVEATGTLLKDPETGAKNRIRVKSFRIKNEV